MAEKLKFSIGYQLPDKYSISEIAQEYRSSISEVYFPWLGVPGGRGISIRDSSEQAEMEEELCAIAECGIRLNLLWNANCYGKMAISKRLADTVRSAIDYLKSEINLSVITTTSLFIAETCRRSYPDIEVRASVNMEIGTLSAIRYVEDYFDSFYLKRSVNRDLPLIRKIREKCGKKLYLLANSGCLADCSAHTFHDNLVAHEEETSREQNEWPGFRGVCWKYLAKKENRLSFLTDSTWIRPEDISHYEGLVDGIKLATRTNWNPLRIVEAYAKGSFQGNMLSLCEPDFSALAEIRNEDFPSDWHERASEEDYARTVLDQVLGPGFRSF